MQTRLEHAKLQPNSQWTQNQDRLSVRRQRQPLHRGRTVCSPVSCAEANQQMAAMCESTSCLSSVHSRGRCSFLLHEQVEERHVERVGDKTPNDIICIVASVTGKELTG